MWSDPVNVDARMVVSEIGERSEILAVRIQIDQ